MSIAEVRHALSEASRDLDEALQALATGIREFESAIGLLRVATRNSTVAEVESAPGALDGCRARSAKASALLAAADVKIKEYLDVL